MPITLQDAIERTKLSADESNLISQYVFDQMIQALDDKDRHSYVTAIADLGIIAKYSSVTVEDINNMRSVISYKDVDIAEEFMKFSQQNPNPQDEEDIYEGLNMDWDEDPAGQGQTIMMDKTNEEWPTPMDPSQQSPSGPLWPEMPGQTYTDPSQSALEYDPEMDLGLDPEVGYGATQMAPINQTQSYGEEALWPETPGQTYTDPSQSELEYDPDLDLSLDPDAPTLPGTIPGKKKKINSIVDKFLKLSQAMLDPKPIIEGTEEDEAMFEGIDDSLYKKFLQDEPDAEDQPEVDPGYEILEERPAAPWGVETDDPSLKPQSEAPQEASPQGEASASLTQAEEFLTTKNISVNPDGTVTFHQGSSGIQGEGVANLDYLLDPNAVTSMPADKAMRFFEQKQRSAGVEMDRIGKLQDNLLKFTKTLTNIDNDIFSTMQGLDDTFTTLEEFKYNESSPNSVISEVAQGLKGIKSGLQDKLNMLTEFAEEFSSGSWKEYLEPVKKLQEKLDMYKETQYDKSMETEQILEALNIVKASVIPKETKEQPLQQQSVASKFMKWRN